MRGAVLNRQNWLLRLAIWVTSAKATLRQAAPQHRQARAAPNPPLAMHSMLLALIGSITYWSTSLPSSPFT